MSCRDQRLDWTILIFVLLINVVLLLSIHSYIVHKSKGKSNIYMVKRNTEWGHHIVNGKLSSYDVYDWKNCHISECIDQPESTYDGVDNQICRAKINLFGVSFFFKTKHRILYLLSWLDAFNNLHLTDKTGWRHTSKYEN